MCVIFGLLKGDLSLSKVHVLFFQPDALKSSCLQKIPIWRELLNFIFPASAPVNRFPWTGLSFEASLWSYRAVMQLPPRL